MKIFFFIFCIFKFFLYLYWLKCDMIQQGLCLEDGQGSLTIQVSCGARCNHTREGLRLPSPQLKRFLACSEANPLTVQNITVLYNLSPGEINKMVIVRPASSVVFSFYLQKWL